MGKRQGKSVWLGILRFYLEGSWLAQ